MRHILQKHPIYTERGSEDCHWLSQDVQCRPLTRRSQNAEGKGTLLGSYKSRIKKNASLNVCVDCGKTPHDVKHLFACPAHPTTLIPSEANQWTPAVNSVISRRET